jgi:myo-inositol-1(or 4)-monophosphatase
MLDTMISVVKRSGDILLFAQNASRSILPGERKAGFVTKYDAAVQESLHRALLDKFQDASFLMEEKDLQEQGMRGLTFIIDPIDGTTNFIKGYKKSCVSVGAAMDGQIVCAVVYNPFMSEMFYARRGGGAFLNGQKIQASGGGLARELVCFGTSPGYPEMIDRTFTLAAKLQRAALDVRLSGSAALDLCDIACGRIGLFFGYQLSPRDYAAGSLIVEEAGGIVSDMDGQPLCFDRVSSVFAGGPQAYQDCRALNLTE